MRGGCVFLQSVLLFSVGNERRIRVLTRPLQVVEHLPRLAQSIHLPTCLSLQTKQAAAALAKQPAKAVSDKLQADAVAALSAQRELLPPPFQKVASPATVYVPGCNPTRPGCHTTRHVPMLPHIRRHAATHTRRASRWPTRCS